MSRRAGSGIALRPFPYPYRAALSICNDADLFTVEKFRRLHPFLSTDDETEWGPGLGLDVGGSFFMFRSPDSPNEFTVFDRLTDEITADGEFILECAQRGILDVLHTYGCFTDATHFTRRLAQTALEVLDRRGIRIETWVNHGPPTNVQGIGTRDEWQGDVPGTPGYHADLTIAHGVRWVWTGTEMTDRIALDAVRGLRRRRPLVEPFTLRDGQTLRRFFRFTGLHGRTPVLEDLPAQLSAAYLDALARAGGYAVVYQHLAVRRRREGFGTEAYGPVDDAWFTEPELEALRRLARRHRDGEIWVAPTTHVLRHRDVQRGLRWRAEADSIVIAAEQPADLADVTFHCERPEATRVIVETPDGAEQVEQLRVNPPDETSRQSITILPRARADALP